MAFFSGLSSSIGKKLLLYGLRQIDILDKDPADFVSVDVGKRTTLEVRDVGLHIKKLVALLHLQLPPEIRLSKARASLLRVTFVLDFGVPQISIQVDGIQVQARLQDAAADTQSPSGSRHSPQAHASSGQSTATSVPDDVSETSSDGGQHVPTVDDVTKSFMRAEPIAEIRELQQELESRSEYMQDPLAYGNEADEDSPTGMGAPLALPTYLRNIINTALDRLSLSVNDIDIEVEDLSVKEEADGPTHTTSSPVSFNFHIESIAIDSITAQDAPISTGPAAQQASESNSGKRRMRIENICARLISDVDNFVSMSKVSRPASPIMTRTDQSTAQLERSATEVKEGPGESSHSQRSLQSTPEVNPDLEVHEEPKNLSEPLPSAQASLANLREEVDIPIGISPMESTELNLLASSQHTVDEDRFADAAYEDEISESQVQPSLRSHQLGGSSILYDDGGILDYALNNDLLDSRFDDLPDEDLPQPDSHFYVTESQTYSATHQSSTSTSQASFSDLPTVSALGHSFHPPSQASTSDLPTVSALGRSFRPPSPTASWAPVRSEESPQEFQADNVAVSEPYYAPIQENTSHHQPQSLASTPQLSESLAESQLFSHDDTESMYMSALSAAQTDSTPQGHVPGGWDSSSTSSRSYASEDSAPVPESMIAGSVLAPPPEVGEGCQTPRPGTPQNVLSSPHLVRATTPLPAAAGNQKQSKLFLSVDQITVWFPLGLHEQDSQGQVAEPMTEASHISFVPPRLGEDSIFAEMPGSFSNYAQSSTHRRKPSMEASTRNRPRVTDQHDETTGSIKDTKRLSALVKIDIGLVAGHMDVSTSRIMYAMLGRVLSALNDQPSPPESNTETTPATLSSLRSVEVTIEKIGISWLENVMTESLLGGHSASRSLSLTPSDAIIRVCLEAVCLSSQTGTGNSRTKLQIGKFVLASLDQDIISFSSPRPTTKRSVIPLPEQLDHDMEINYEQAKDQRITIVTRPVKVLFDLQKLDDALGSFGGFSGVLELSNSISSTNTISSPSISPSRSQLRGVHFGDTPRPTPQVNVSSQPSPKIQLQLGEVAFTLRGRSCALQLQTTSVRVAVRGGNIRLKVSEVKLEGPYTEEEQRGAPLLVDIKGTTVNFLFAPEESDLARLISMITPSKDPYENNEDILIETLLRQRRKGSVLRVEVTSVGVRVLDLQEMRAFETLGAELTRLSKVTKYLPDDDRPGLLTLASLQHLDAGIAINEQLGDISVTLKDASIAHVGLPALLALELGQATVKREDEILVHELTQVRQHDRLPAIMVRMVGDEMEPIVKAKFFNVCAEYRVSTVLAALGLSEDGTADDIALGIAASVATITGGPSPKSLSRQSSEASSPSTTTSKPLQIDLLLRDCAVGLNPNKITSKALFVLTEAHIAGKQTKLDYSITIDLRKASVHAIDDTNNLDKTMNQKRTTKMLSGNRQLSELQDLGFCLLSSISAAHVYVIIRGDGKNTPQQVDVELKNELFVLESCADSTQTLIAIMNGLQPPTPPSTAEKYRPMIPLQQMMESFTGDALLAPDEIDQEDFMNNADLVDDEVPTNLEFVGSIYNSQSLPTEEELGDSMLGEDDLEAFTSSPNIRQRGDRGLLESFQEQYEVTEDEKEFVFNDNYFKETDKDNEGKARKWDSAKNQYHLSNEFKTPEAPLKLRVRDVNIIWNLYDGYDWQRTRDIISQAVDDVEARAEQRRKNAQEEDEDDDFVEEDFLFNSVWVGVPVKDEKGALARRINHDIDDLASETGSYATSTATRSTGATARSNSAAKSKRRLKLNRSKHKKIAFSLMGVAVDLVVFPPDSGETINSLDVRVREFELFDHVPTSTWKKFVTCLIEPHARQVTKPMIELEVVTVKPVTDLAASELVVKVTVLPLRLHVDQDALDFITRFFEFKDDSSPATTSASTSEQPFIQRLEVQAVTLKLDYKPKRVDYRGLRSGHTTEFMNFLILDGSDIVLRHAIVYGLTSFDKVHKTLNDVWMPDVQRNQLPGVLSGLAAVRPLVNVGSGMRDLVVVPMREYKKDGRVVRSLQKGVYAFAKNTTSEVARLGAKVAIGTQNLLEGAETFLAPQTGTSPRSIHSDWDGEDPSGSPPEEARAVSHYANQPLGVKAGLRSAAHHLERDLLTARDAVIAIPAEVMEQGSGVGVARALARHAPTVILRPALGATKALSNALLGVGNALDERSRRKVEDKYKSY